MVCMTITLFSVPEQNPAIYNSEQLANISVTNPTSQDSRQENCSTASNCITKSTGELELGITMIESHKNTVEFNNTSTSDNNLVN